MMNRDISAEVSLAAAGNVKESEFWLNTLCGELQRCGFPREQRTGQPGGEYSTTGYSTVNITFPPELSGRLAKVVKGSDPRLHILLTAAVTALLNKYTGMEDIMVGVPVYRQGVEGKFVNTVLVLRNRLWPGMTFKELILHVRETLTAAVKHQNYPLETLLYKLDIDYDKESESFPLFDTVVLLENIHDKEYILHTRPGVIFSFCRGEDGVTGGVLEYDRRYYDVDTAEAIVSHLGVLLGDVLFDIDRGLGAAEFLPPGLKKRLLEGFSGAATGAVGTDYPRDITIPEMFAHQVALTPDRAAVAADGHYLTYRELDRRSDALASALRAGGLGPGGAAALLTERRVDSMVNMLGILKAGGAYVPLELNWPGDRVFYTLRDCLPRFLLTEPGPAAEYGFTALRSRGPLAAPLQPRVTAPRPPIDNLDDLPFPDRSLVDAGRYAHHISLAMVKGSISIQATRGCPYECAYCARLWSRKHRARSAEHIFAEVKLYHDMGVRRFSFIDDIFNLKVENSERFFQLVIDHGLDIQILFPAGLRGDIMTPEYIDLMVRAGTVNISVALETASPRLQKMIKKNLDVDRLRENLRYICDKHPQVIIDLFTMHGFPTETEEEAMMTLEFIKDLKWLHFPLINVLKIYPNTDMERLALAAGVSRQAIIDAENAAWHEFSDTLPFDKNFTTQYQADFLNDYFLLKERLLNVLPHQMRVLTAEEIVMKYNSYLSEDIKDFDQLLDFFGIGRDELGVAECVPGERFAVPDLNDKIRAHFPAARKAATDNPDTFGVLLLDLTQSFSDRGRQLDDLVETPLGSMYLMTWLKKELGDSIRGQVAKSGMDFDNYDELRQRVGAFKPKLIGIRTLTFYKELFHQTVSLLRQWGFDGVIVAGGPYATNSYATLLRDGHVDLVVTAEGEVTLTAVVEAVMAHKGRLPDDNTLQNIPGIVFMPREVKHDHQRMQDVLMPGVGGYTPSPRSCPSSAPSSPVRSLQPSDPAYIIYTSGSTGRPKGVVIEHRSVINLVYGLRDRVYADYPVPQRVAVLAPFSFDASVKQLFAALLTGHTLHIVPEEARLESGGTADFFRRYGIQVSDGTPTHLMLLAEAPGGSSGFSLRHLLVGGEELTPGVVRDFYGSLGSGAEGIDITNVYGPTECCVDATAHRLRGSAGVPGSIPIGTPMPNVGVLILTPRRAPLPPGAPGELCITGRGVGRGYLNNPELTAQKFLPPRPPMSCHLSYPIYFTGDLARQRADGTIEYLGRVDRQVKVRGYRIELGEIEARTRGCDNVRDVAVVLRGGNTDEGGGEKTICAYVVLAGAGDDGVRELRRALVRVLPAYMVPVHIVEMADIPRTVNGKVDRRALPEPRAGAGDHYVAPADAVEEELVRLWSDVLQVEPGRISTGADFFEMGGHSLKAVVLVSRIHKTLGVKVPIAEIFRVPTVRGLAGYVSQYLSESGGDSFGGDFRALPLAEDREYYPLSSAQRRLYVLQQMVPDSVFYNVPYAARVEGELRVRDLERALTMLAARHEGLRTSFFMAGGEVMQKVHDRVDIALESHATPGDADEMIRAFIRPFDPERAPLLRVGLGVTGGGDTLLMFDMHHIISDGVSMNLLVEDFLALYAGGDPKPPVYRYRDYALWQQGPGATGRKEQEAYWLKVLGGELPVTDLPLDRGRPTVQSFAGDTLEFHIDGADTAALNRLARENGATLYMVLLAVYSTWLGKLAGTGELLVGTPTAGRRHADLQQIIGIFINTLVIRCFPHGDKGFIDYLREIKGGLLGAYEHQDYPFEALAEKLAEAGAIRRDPGRNPLFDVLFSLQNTGNPEPRIPNLALRPYPFKTRTSRLDLSFQVNERANENQGGGGASLSVDIEYRSGLFDESTIRRFFGYFMGVVRSVTAAPGQKIADIEIITEAEKKHILQDFNGGIDGGINDRIDGLLAERARRGPDRTALVYGDCRVTHGELLRRADGIAAGLREKNVGPGSVVGVMMPPSTELVIALLGVLRTGAAYLPLDPAYPEERTRYMTADAGVRLVLKGDHREENRDAVGGGPSGGLSGAPAYVIYTSGSTGRPRGVVVEHGNAVRLVKHGGFMPLEEGGRLLMTGNIVFDITAFEIWGALLNGPVLHLAPTDSIVDGGKLKTLLQKHRVSILHLVPQLFNRLFSAPGGPEIFAELEYFLVGGDLVGPVTINTLHQRFPQLNILHMYGPTENTTFSTCYPVTGELGARIPIGKAIGGSMALVVDRYGHLQPVGVTGELLVGGAGVARGYLNNPELTAEKFINRNDRPHHFYKTYKTGDLARWGRDGNLEFLGRRDGQVKVRGMRVELGEIQTRLAGHPDVKGAVVTVAAPGGDGEPALCAYVVPAKVPTKADGTKVDGTADTATLSATLKENLATVLPRHMVPTHIMVLDAFPLTPNGKLNRAALPIPGVTTGPYAAPRDALEKTLSDIWSDALGGGGNERRAVGIDNDFFELGGHSLKAMTIVSRIRRELEVEVALARLFEMPTIRRFAGYIRQLGHRRFEKIEAVEKQEYYPMSSAQKRLYFFMRLNPLDTSFNMSQALDLGSGVDADHLGDVFRALIRSHEILRTSFHMAEGAPVQRVNDDAAFKPERYTDVPGGGVENFVKPFDMEQAPLIRVAIVEKSDGKRLLMVDIHHIIMDAVSMNILIDDFNVLFRGGSPAVPGLQYKDFSAWQNRLFASPAIKEQENYWLGRFHGPVPRLNLPLDFPRPEKRQTGARRVVVDFGEQMTARLNQLAQETETTLFMLLMTVSHILLYRYTDQEDVVVGLSIAGRSHPGLERVMGMFVNIMALRSFPQPDKTFGQYLTEIKKDLLDAYDNQDYPFEELVDRLELERDLSRTPLFDVAFGMGAGADGPAPVREFGAPLEKYEFDLASARFDLVFFARQKDDKLSLAFSYAVALFKEETIEKMSAQFREILEQVTENPGIILKDIELGGAPVRADDLSEEDDEEFNF